LLSGPPKPIIDKGLAPFTVHRMADAKDRDALIRAVAPRVRAIASSVSNIGIGGDLMAKLPRLEIVSTFRVGYDHVDVAGAAAPAATATTPPQALPGEAPDAARGLRLCAGREFPQAVRSRRAGKGAARPYPPTKAPLRTRRVGRGGMGGMGRAIARRL